ncbi:TOMM precursor leader peptide-binding protein [Diaminobutyricibacter sp. McL0618]|uniref:TOMM precursor leader peptide-binding protein n=1 Tax=Leifsonia sp. McL0618 TaxID=3415677 RepID=UPI003CE6FA04
MTIQLDPRIPRVWRSPTDLQFGVDRHLLVLHDVTPGEERLIADLEHGVTRDGLTALASAARVPVDVDALLTRLRPVLRAPAPSTPPPRRRVAIDGRGSAARAIGNILTSSGFAVTSDIADVDRAEAAVIVGRYAVAPERYGRWLRRDVPHLAVVFSDRTVTIGPIVEPGSGPCLSCLDRHRLDDDPAWTAIATQLATRDSPLETELVGTAVAALASRMVLARLTRGSRRFAASSIRYDGATGTTDVVPVRQHAECACRALPGTVTAGGGRAAGRLRPS